MISNKVKKSLCERQNYFWKTTFHKKDYLASWEDKRNFGANFYFIQSSVALNCEISENPFCNNCKGGGGGGGGGGADVDCRRILKNLGVASLKRVSLKQISYMF